MEGSYKVKGKIYQLCRPAMWYRSDTCCLRENERAMLRTKKALIGSNVWS